MRKNEVIKRTIVFLFAQLSKAEKKQLIDAIAEGAKLTKADAGKILALIPEADLTGIGLITGMNKVKLIDSIAASAKLSKADAGRVSKIENEALWRKLKTVFGGKGQ